METYAIVWDGGVIPVQAKGPEGARRKCWMLEWYEIYDSNGSLIASKAKEQPGER